MMSMAVTCVALMAAVLLSLVPNVSATHAALPCHGALPSHYNTQPRLAIVLGTQSAKTLLLLLPLRQLHLLLPMHS